MPRNRKRDVAEIGAELDVLQIRIVELRKARLAISKQMAPLVRRYHNLALKKRLRERS